MFRGMLKTYIRDPVFDLRENGLQKQQDINKVREGIDSMETTEKVQAKSELHRILWTSVGGKGERDSFHFFSAYYDNRSMYFRPAVIAIGYAWNEVKQRPLYCMFKYKNGHTECVKKPLKMLEISSCMASKQDGKPYSFYCPAQQHFPPASVMVSEKSDCDPQFTSNEIMVGNLNQIKRSPKKFGVCVGGPVIGHNESLQDLVEFISISKILGAELITIYIIPEQLENSTMNYLLKRYPDVLRLIEWKKFGRTSPLHYYGQFLIIQDCLYRSMYEVEYLFHQDIDEVFIPIGVNNWADMVTNIPYLKVGAGFKYHNAFFTLDKAAPDVKFLTNNCGNLKVPKYLTRTKRLPCYNGYKYRPKLMTKPRLTLEVGVHDVCVVMPGYSTSLPVPTRLAILGHFRNNIPEDCIKLKRTPATELWASKYADRLHEEMC